MYFTENLPGKHNIKRSAVSATVVTRHVVQEMLARTQTVLCGAENWSCHPLNGVGLEI